MDIVYKGICARFHKPNEPLTIEESPNGWSVDSLPPEAALIRVTYAGICHTDLHIQENGYAMGDGVTLTFTERGLQYPIQPGHEILGEIVLFGQAAPHTPSLRIGDRVIVYPWIGCGECALCTRGDEHLCVGKSREIGFSTPGGYSEYCVVPHTRYLVPVEGVPGSRSLAILPCAGLTAFNAVSRIRAEPLDQPLRVLVLGCGGVGMMAVRWLKCLHSNAIIHACDKEPSKREPVLSAGADYFICTEEVDKEKMRQIQFDYALDFVNSPTTFQFALEFLRRGGTLIAVGLMGGAAKLSLPLLITKAINIQGVMTGRLDQLIELVDLIRQQRLSVHGLPQMRLIGFHELNDTLTRLRDGKVVGRTLLVPQGRPE